MEESPIHYFHPITYHVPCGDGNKIFSEGHGGSIYEAEITCPKCKKHFEDIRALDPQSKWEGWPE